MPFLKRGNLGVGKAMEAAMLLRLDPLHAFGDKSAVTLKTKEVEKLMGRRAARPDSGNGLRKVLREMMKVAVKLEWRDTGPTQGARRREIAAPARRRGRETQVASTLIRSCQRQGVRRSRCCRRH